MGFFQIVGIEYLEGKLFIGAETFKEMRPIIKNDSSGANIHMVLIGHCDWADGMAPGRICRDSPYVMNYACHGGYRPAVYPGGSGGEPGLGPLGLAFTATHEIGHNLGI